MQQYITTIENILSNYIDKSLVQNSVVVSKNGDISFACFKLSKTFNKAPQTIALELAEKINALNNQVIQSVVCLNGYLNIYLNRQQVALDVINAPLTLFNKKNETIVIDYSSINIAKPFHIGHLLSTAIGGSLYRIYKYLGYNVVGINHLGDWGTQFGKLVCAYKLWGDDADIKNRGINALLDLYVKFHAEAEKNPDLEQKGRDYFKLIENGDEHIIQIYNMFIDITLAEVNKTYNRLGVVFDSYKGESFFSNKIVPVVQELKQKNLLEVSDGAQVVNLDNLKLPPCLILKNDGTSLYASRDLAAAVYRKKEYNFVKCLYVVAYQQNLHFKQVFAVLDKMGYSWAKDCVHVPFGMVSLIEGTLSTRKGNVVFLNDVLNTAVKKTQEIISAKNSNLPDCNLIAEDVGVGAVLFWALSSSKIKDTVFSFADALEFDGETGPYLMYTHARCCSLLAKADYEFKKINETDAEILTDDASYNLIKLLSQFDTAVLKAAETYEPSIVSCYLIDLCQTFTKFYTVNKILTESQDIKNARLSLVQKTKDTLALGLQLILLKAPVKM